MKQVITLFRQDVTNALRDNMMIYMLVAPLLLAVGARLLLPSLEQAKVTYAVDEAVGPDVIARLEQLGDVELFADAQAVLARVERLDDVPGIVLAEGGYEVLLEGNEPEGEEVAAVALSAALREAPVATIDYQQADAGRSLLVEYGAVMLVLLAVMMGALIAGFLMVHEKEALTIRALAVSPLTLTAYTVARALFALVFSLIITMISSAILVGTAVDYGLLLAGSLIASSVGIVVGYLIGGFAASQMQALAVVKIVMNLYLLLPLASIFVPAGWQWLFYALPNYWMFKTFETLYIGQQGPFGFWATAGLTLLTSVLYLAAMVVPLRERMRLRFA